MISKSVTNFQFTTHIKYFGKAAVLASHFGVYKNVLSNFVSSLLMFAKAKKEGPCGPSDKSL
jgi:hypothetical protein